MNERSWDHAPTKTDFCFSVPTECYKYTSSINTIRINTFSVNTTSMLQFYLYNYLCSYSIVLINYLMFKSEIKRPMNFQDIFVLSFLLLFLFIVSYIEPLVWLAIYTCIAIQERVKFNPQELHPAVCLILVTVFSACFVVFTFWYICYWFYCLELITQIPNGFIERPKLVWNF